MVALEVIRGCTCVNHWMRGRVRIRLRTNWMTKIRTAIVNTNMNSRKSLVTMMMVITKMISEIEI